MKKKNTNYRMLYLVGGPNAERVDISVLFARHIADGGLTIDYVIFDPQQSASWSEKIWRGANAYVVGSSQNQGMKAAVINKFFELAADLRTFKLALQGDYDIIQIRDKFIIGVLGLIVARIRKIRFTYWLSYPYAEGRILDGIEKRSRIPWLSIAGGHTAAWLLYKIILPNADHIFVQSQQMLKDVEKKGISTALMTAVPMAVSEELLDLPQAEVEPGTILYLGTLIRVRQLDVLIHALKIVIQKHKHARLIFVGEGEGPEDRQFLEEIAGKQGLIDSIEFTGMLPIHEAHKRVSKAAVCVSPFYPTPILQSTSPTKISEYMALGRPVVANSHPEQSIIIEESQAGVCVEWSAESFARGIIKFLDDPVAAEVIGARGKQYVRQHRIYPVIAPVVARQYEKLMENPENLSACNKPAK